MQTSQVTKANNHISWLRAAPFFLIHVGCLGVLGVGVSWFAVLVCLLLYGARMFAITAFYHRYFSHRTFRTSRLMQFLFAVAGNTAAQKGPLWWAAHHRHHHKHSDTAEDRHSLVQRGFWWSHMWWFMADGNRKTNMAQVRDLSRYPELRFLDRFEVLAPLALILGLFGLGELLATHCPSLHTSGWQLLVWGFCISTCLLFHCTFTINSLAHRCGRRRFSTKDESRNSMALALLTLGEGWHNNHHFYPVSVRQGFRWWEIDVSFYLLWVMAKLRLIWDLQPVPDHVQRGQRVPSGQDSRVQDHAA